jgi:hypothetical protein
MGRRPQRSEHAEQSAVITWARMSAGRWPCLAWLHAIPNGGARADNPRLAAIRGAQLKAEGVTRGISDLFLPAGRRGFHGLYIEMKRPGALSELRPEQRAFLEYCESAGYLAQAFDNADDAIAAITDYVSGPTVTR